MTDRTDSELWKAIWDVLQNSPGIINTWSETATKILTGDLVTAVEELELIEQPSLTPSKLSKHQAELLKKAARELIDYLQAVDQNAPWDYAEAVQEFNTKYLETLALPPEEPSATLPVEEPDDFKLSWETTDGSMHTAKIITETGAASVCTWLSNGYWYVWRSNDLVMECLDYCSKLSDAQEVARQWARDWVAKQPTQEKPVESAIQKQVAKEMEGLKEIVTNPSGKWVGLKGGSALFVGPESERFQNEYMLQAVGPKVLQFNLRDVEDFGNHQLCGILMQPNVWFEAQPLSHVQYHIGQVSATKWWFVPIYGGAVGPRRYGEKQREVVAMAQATWEAYQKERARQ